MADEEKVVEEKKSGGGGGGIIPLITLVLVVVSIGVSAFSLITVMGVSTSMQEMAEQAAKPDAIPGAIDVNELTTWSFTDQFIFQYKNPEKEGVTDTVVVNISLGILNNEDTAKDAATLVTTLGSNENIIRSGVEAMMLEESFSDFQSAEGLDVIREDLLTYLRERLVSELIVDVYFTGKVTTSN